MRSGVTPDNGPNDPPPGRHRRGGQAWSQTPKTAPTSAPKATWSRTCGSRGSAAISGNRALGDGEVQPGDDQARERARERPSTPWQHHGQGGGPPERQCRVGHQPAGQTGPAEHLACGPGRAERWAAGRQGVDGRGRAAQHAGHHRGTDDLVGGGDGPAGAAAAPARHGLLPARGQIVGTSSRHRPSKAWSPTTSTPACCGVLASPHVEQQTLGGPAQGDVALGVLPAQLTLARFGEAQQPFAGHVGAVHVHRLAGAGRGSEVAHEADEDVEVLVERVRRDSRVHRRGRDAGTTLHVPPVDKRLVGHPPGPERRRCGRLATTTSRRRRAGCGRAGSSSAAVPSATHAPRAGSETSGLSSDAEVRRSRSPADPR